MAKSKLKQALERHKGIDQKLERQKKLRKEAEKKTRTKELKKAKKQILEEEEEKEGNPFIDGEAEEDEAESAEEGVEWETDEEEGGIPLDLERLNDSDSSSDEDEGIPATNGKKPINGAALEDPADDEDEEEDEEDIPLSDIESLASEDKGDVIPHQRLTINNTTALLAAHKRFALPISKLPFSVHHTVITAEPVSIPDIDDDLNRELAFYSQSLSSVREARKLLKAEGVMFTRPVDYFAEMVKSDEHMGRVKQKLVDEAAGKKAAAEARRQRDLKKFGKQVQVAKLQERDKAKKDTMDKIGLLKRKRSSMPMTAENEPDLFDVELEDTATTAKKDRAERKQQASGQPTTKRRKKDEKYGFGGKKRFGKSGDAESSADMKGFSVKKMKSGVKKAGNQRPGKARRMKGRL